MKLGETVRLVRGRTYKSSLLSDVEGPVLLGLGSIEKNGGFKTGTRARYPGESDESILLHPGDLYVSLKDLTQSCDLLGAVSRVPSSITEGRLTQDTVKLVFSDDEDEAIKLYVYWSLRTPQYRRYCKAHGTGTTNMSLSRKDFLNWSIPERTYARDVLISLLEMLEKKADVITQLNGYLEELASVLYKKFVASADGRMGTLADLVELQKDGARAGKHPELPYMPIDVMPMKHFGVTEFKANEEAKSSLQLFRRDDIVIGAMRVYFHRVVLAPCEGITRNTCFVLRPRSSSLREYALLTCFQPEAIEYANVRSKGSTMPYAVWENSFETYPVLIPEEGQLDRFSRQLAPLIDQIRDSCRENNRLASLRDALLPKLMSGEIDVSEIDLTQLNSHLA